MSESRVKGKTWWQWTFGCATAVYFVMAESRGKSVPTAFLAGAKPKMWLSAGCPRSASTPRNTSSASRI